MKLTKQELLDIELGHKGKCWGDNPYTYPRLFEHIHELEAESAALRTALNPDAAMIALADETDGRAVSGLKRQIAELEDKNSDLRVVINQNDGQLSRLIHRLHNAPDGQYHAATERAIREANKTIIDLRAQLAAAQAEIKEQSNTITAQSEIINARATDCAFWQAEAAKSADAARALEGLERLYKYIHADHTNGADMIDAVNAALTAKGLPNV